MTEFNQQRLADLKGALALESMQMALPNTVGGSSLAGGFWRLFSKSYPEGGGIHYWNSAENWRKSWPTLASNLFFFGEDIFGNQLTLLPERENVFLWNHENEDLVDLLLDPLTLLETVFQSGIDWIDFYIPKMISIGRTRLLDIPESCHLHWTQPLILAGPMDLKNTSVVNSVSHLKFHGELWAKLRGLPPGTEIIFKPA